MTNRSASGVPGFYWAVAILALLWEAAGCYAYVAQVTIDPAQLAALPPAQRDIWLAMPSWVTGAYAVAVWAGLAGAIGLLLRRRWAGPAFIASLAAVLVQFGWTFLATDILATMPVAESVPFPAFIILMAAVLLWFSSLAARKHWLS
jgi:hypothetical protein